MRNVNQSCNYQDPDGFTCPNMPTSNGSCFWHDAKSDKTKENLREKLERYVSDGGFTRGLSLKHANLAYVDLVNHHCSTGYDFSYADFYRANLFGAHLFNINLAHASLMKADLKNAKLNCANLASTNLLGVKWKGCKIENIKIGKVLWQESLAKNLTPEDDISQANDYFEQAEEVYRDLRKHSEQEGIFRLSGRLIQKELTMRRMQQPKYSFKRISSKVVDLFCGYGEAPLRIVGISMLMILACAILYTFTGISYQGEVIAFDSGLGFIRNINLFFSCLYYSVVTFTTLGYGDITPVGISRAIAAIEAFTGSFTIALFVVVFVKKMTR